MLATNATYSHQLIHLFQLQTSRYLIVQNIICISSFSLNPTGWGKPFGVAAVVRESSVCTGHVIGVPTLLSTGLIRIFIVSKLLKIILIILISNM